MQCGLHARLAQAITEFQAQGRVFAQQQGALYIEALRLGAIQMLIEVSPGQVIVDVGRRQLQRSFGILQGTEVILGLSVQLSLIHI